MRTKICRRADITISDRKVRNSREEAGAVCPAGIGLRRVARSSVCRLLGMLLAHPAPAQPRAPPALLLGEKNKQAKS